MKVIPLLTACAFPVLLFSQHSAPTNTPKGVKFLERADKKDKNDIMIPFSKYQLDNGMTLLIHEDHSDPVVYVDVTYHVGSNREQEGRSGFAHFFEHMMFQGSKHVGDEQHFKFVTEAGGTMNGTTNTDRTNYFEVLPSNQLELALWLESDRMGYLLDSVTQEKFEVQRATVKNERGQRYDNAPYGLVQEKIGEAMFPEGHSYSWTTIGYIADLNRVDVSDLKRFYLRWYGPNNATLTLAGDINLEKAIALVEKYFGPIPRGPEVKDLPKTPALLTENRYISYEDNVKFPQINLVWATAPSNTKDAMCMDAMAYLLSGTRSSPFQQNFIKNKKAIQAFSFQYDREMAGLFMAQVRANKDDSLSSTEKQIEAIMDLFQKQPVSPEILTEFKNISKSRIISSLATVNGKGATLAANQTLAHDAGYLSKEIKMLDELTAENLRQAWTKYVQGKPHLVLSVVPKGKGALIAKQDTWKMYERKIEPESQEYKNLTYKPLSDGFDRSKNPAPGAPPIVVVPAFWKSKAPNGLQFIGTETDEIPKVSIIVSTRAGHKYETPDKAGLAYLCANMMNETTQNFTPEDMDNRLNTLGSSIDVSCNQDEINVNISSLTENIEKTLVLAEEIMFKSKFTQEDFDRCKKQQLDAIQQQQSNAGILAEQNFNRLLHNKEDIGGLPVIGTPETVQKLTLDDVKNYYKTHYSPSATKLMVVGNINEKNLMPKLSYLTAWKDFTPSTATPIPPPAISSTKIYFVDKKNAPQSEIRIGCNSLPYDAFGDYYKSTIFNFPLGGAFNSRVNLLLREKRSFTYGARSSFNGGLDDGTFEMSAAVRANVTDSAVTDFMTVLKEFSEKGMTAEELNFTRSSLVAGEALKYEAPFQKAIFLKRILEYKLDRSFVKKQTELLSAATLSDLNALAKKELLFNNMNIIVVGDKKTWADKIKTLGYEVIFLDAP